MIFKLSYLRKKIVTFPLRNFPYVSNDNVSQSFIIDFINTNFLVLNIVNCDCQEVSFSLAKLKMILSKKSKLTGQRLVPGPQFQIKQRLKVKAKRKQVKGKTLDRDNVSNPKTKEINPNCRIGLESLLLELSCLTAY